jgi:hypothetical protein
MFMAGAPGLVIGSILAHVARTLGGQNRLAWSQDALGF